MTSGFHPPSELFVCRFDPFSGGLTQKTSLSPRRERVGEGDIAAQSKLAMRRNIQIRNTLQRDIWHRYTLPDPHASGESVILQGDSANKERVISDQMNERPNHFSTIPLDNCSTTTTCLIHVRQLQKPA